MHASDRVTCFIVALGMVAAASCASGSPSVPAAGSDAGHSWMNPKATSSRSLLYVSNVSNVTVYDYNNGSNVTLVGTLTGFSLPEGLCSDQSGDVWVSDYNTRTMFEFAHGGTTPIATIVAKVGFPYACAVDRSGNLAVSYWHPNGHYRDYSEVVIIPPGQTNGRSYGPPTGFYRSYFLTFDNNGNLFTNGLECGYYECYNSKSNLPLFELPAGGTGFTQLSGANHQQSISGLVWVNPSFLMGTGKSGDKGASAVKVQVTGGQAKVVGKVAFDQTFLTYGFTVRAGLAIVPDYAGNVVRIYKLSDGSLVSSFSQGISQPFSTVVSQK